LLTSCEQTGIRQYKEDARLFLFIKENFMLERTISRKVVEWLYGHGIIERSESNIYVYAYELLISSSIFFKPTLGLCVEQERWAAVGD